MNRPWRRQSGLSLLLKGRENVALRPDAPVGPGQEIRLVDPLICGSEVDGKKPLKRTGTMQQSLDFFSDRDLSIDGTHGVGGGSPCTGTAFSENRNDKRRIAGGPCCCPRSLWICAVGSYCGSVQPTKRLIVFRLPVLHLPGRLSGVLRSRRKPLHCSRLRRYVLHGRVIALVFQRRYPTSALAAN